MAHLSMIVKYGDYMKYSVGMVIISKICPALSGQIKRLYDNQNAVISIKDRQLKVREMVVNLEYWYIST